MRPQQLCEEALAQLPDGGIVLVDVSYQANIRFANNTMTTNGTASRFTMTVVALHPRSSGISTGVMAGVVQSADDVQSLVAAARASALAADDASDAAELTTGARPTTQWSAPAGETSLDAFKEFAPALKEAFESARSRQEILYGFAFHDVTTTYLATSSGLRLRHEQGTGTLEMTGRDGNSSAWFGQAGSGTEFDPISGADELHRRLGWSKRKIDIQPGRHATVMPPTTISDLMIYLLWSAEGRAASEGRSVFSQPGKAGQVRIGEKISQRALTLLSDPSIIGIESSPFVIAHSSNDMQSVFDNGAPLTPTAWINNGAIAHLIGPRATAGELGLDLRPAGDNLVLKDSNPTHQSINELISGLDKGLLLTSLWYIREVDPVTLLLTGLTRDGVYVVDNGEIVGVTTNFRFNESPLDILGRIAATTLEERCMPREWSDWFTRTIAPAVLVPDFNCSTTSPGI